MVLCSKRTCMSNKMLESWRKLAITDCLFQIRYSARTFWGGAPKANVVHASSQPWSWTWMGVQGAASMQVQAKKKKNALAGGEDGWQCEGIALCRCTPGTWESEV